jgi:hypothetical protein
MQKLAAYLEANITSIRSKINQITIQVLIANGKEGAAGSESA